MLYLTNDPRYRQYLSTSGKASKALQERKQAEAKTEEKTETKKSNE